MLKGEREERERERVIYICLYVYNVYVYIYIERLYKDSWGSGFRDQGLQFARSRGPLNREK